MTTETTQEAAPEVPLLAAVGAKIRAARERAGLTQEDVAHALYVTQTAVSYWEAGKRDPGVADLMRIAAVTGCTPSSLLPFEEPGQADPRPDGFWGRVEIAGYRDATGWVTEQTRFGQQCAVVTDWEGRETGAFILGPNSRVLHLPTPMKRPEPPKAISAWGETEDDLSEYLDNDEDEPV